MISQDLSIWLMKVKYKQRLMLLKYINPIQIFLLVFYMVYDVLISMNIVIPSKIINIKRSPKPLPNDK